MNADGLTLRGVGVRAGLGLALALGFVACGSDRTGEDDCMVGAINCDCTPGGGCDPDLTCANGVCISGADDTATTGPTSNTNSTTMTAATETGELILDVGGTDVPGNCAETGCKAVDMLFALDSSLSMIEEIGALTNTAAFTEIVTALSELNCGEIDFRVGLTNDNDGGFISTIADPWFDSEAIDPGTIATAFGAAADTVLGNGGTGIGCEHVLSSAADLLASDSTGFLRDDALLVLVLVTDVDDFGFYDQLGWPDCAGGICPCDQLCATAGAEVADIYDNLVALKGGDENAVAAIVVAGDPAVMEGMNLCGQPATCCGVGLECGQAHHAPRLWDFAAAQTGSNGYTADICAGAQTVPTAIRDALENEIDLACQTFEPEG